MLILPPVLRSRGDPVEGARPNVILVRSSWRRRCSRRLKEVKSIKDKDKDKDVYPVLSIPSLNLARFYFVPQQPIRGAMQTLRYRIVVWSENGLGRTEDEPTDRRKFNKGERVHYSKSTFRVVIRL